MDRRSPTPWLVAMLVILLAGGGFAVLAEARADDTAGTRITAQREWAALESAMAAQMTRATHGRAPFDGEDPTRLEPQLRERQQALAELAPHAEAEVETFVSLLLALATPEDAAREGAISRTIIDTRGAVLGPLQERAEAWESAATWSLWLTLGLAAVGAAGGLRRALTP
ncbi:hypothetical protein CFK38_05005 [Brachybacterium vulturis]|uniref:Uncharacterized protein n=1 Tax=Brachybacterium vulturis TaxID=2017484 RepID=A0A291GL61_9MICO|nr:hypothetical protein [Brachybacterium vulturis]ATG50961.1 hypothetical protein CFK38_05005 [Brachybacterium vulturis]